MATRGRKPKQAESSISKLIAGLEFISVAQRKEGEHTQTHCVLNNNWVLASDGAITAGYKIEDNESETIKAVPRTVKFLAVLKKCDGFVSMVQLNENKITVKSKKFTASIDCLNFKDMPEFYPDPNIAVINDSIKLAFKACIPILNESSPKSFFAGLLLQQNTAVATNGAVLIEFWHGLDLPPGLVIPKAACRAIADVESPLKGFGFTDNSATFHFEDESFIKTQLFENHYPNYLKVLEITSNAWPVPVGFYEAVDTLLEFTKNGTLYFHNNKMHSHELEGEGEAYDISGLTGGIKINGNYLKLIEKDFVRADFAYTNESIFFFSDNARGVIKGLRE